MGYLYQFGVYLILFILFIFISIRLYEYYLSFKLRNLKTGKHLNIIPFYQLFLDLMLNKNLIKSQAEQKKKYGNIYGSFLINQFIFIVHSQTGIKQIFSDSKTFIKQEQPKSPIIDLVPELFSPNHIVALNGNDWKRHRESIEKGFTNLSIYVNEMNKKIAQVSQMFEKQSEWDDISKITQNLTLDILGKTIFDFEFQSLEDKLDDLKYYNKIIHTLQDLKKIMLLFIPYFSNSLKKEIVESSNHLIKLFNKLIQQSKDKMKNNFTPTCLLDYMILSNENQQLSDQELLLNVFVFFLAGHETTSISLQSNIQLLAKHQDIQTKLRQEINEKLKGNEPNDENIKDMEYLSSIIKESMRLYPPITLVGKETSKDVHIDDHFVPKGTLIGIPIYEVQRNEEIYKNPNDFKPERWIGEEGKKIPTISWIPFSLGSRICIGNNFSLLEQKLFLIQIVKHFKFEFVNPNDDIELKNALLIGFLPKKIKFTNIL